MKTIFMCKYTNINEEAIEQLVHRFYESVRADEALGPIFHKAIGRDQAEWDKHLSKLCDFWSSVMLRSGRYYGNPVLKHVAFKPISPYLFERWLGLFHEKAYDIFIPEVANEFALKSSQIAESLKVMTAE